MVVWFKLFRYNDYVTKSEASVASFGDFLPQYGSPRQYGSLVHPAEHLNENTLFATFKIMIDFWVLSVINRN